jgi:hypothetical protein
VYGAPMSATATIEDDDRLVVYPSTLVRPTPNFRLIKPAGWLVAEVPQSLLTVVAIEAVDGVLANAALIHERVLPTMSLKDAAETSWAHIKDSSPDATVEDQKIVSFGDLEVYLRGVNIPATTESPAVGQMHAIFFGPDRTRPTVDLFQLIGTAAKTEMEQLLPVFFAMVSSFKFL